MPGRRTVVLVMRHGQTAWNALGRFQGHTDVPLNDVGRQQASRAAEHLRGLPVARVVSSDLQRAQQTAHPTSAALQLPVEVQPALRERSFGMLEGLTWDEIDAQYPAVGLALRENPGVSIAQGESGQDVRARSWPAFWAVADHMAGWADGLACTLVVTHGGVMRAWMLDVLGADAPPYVPNAVAYRFEVEARRVVAVTCLFPQGELED